ncbi:elongation factor P hydroxylase [Congregibacter brevis]|uniref:Elongation factor P hydroxylase n=1 Tax=Congregibacter brevis TaxID=3081201 RepID=A0ABZ0IA23_9GAMM|nr:elongation factor P hydroxylase [Congregibacter sp. IMCC45268]
MNSAIPLSKALEAEQIIEIFNDLFLVSHDTCLKGGAMEPLYEPSSTGAPACIYFREDFASSALHEIAHWCIAGTVRRKQLDYGYWYDPDGRGSEAQQAFLNAEARPQALEWCFARSSGIRFSLSMDNLDAPIDAEAASRFASAVVIQARGFVAQGLPRRAERMFDALAASRGLKVSLDTLEFAVEDLR